MLLISSISFTLYESLYIVEINIIDSRECEVIKMMSQKSNSLNLERAYLFKKGKNGRFVSYDDYGEVIIAENCVKPGYYMINNIVKDLKKCYVVDVSQEVLVDYYNGMSYDQFKNLLKMRGYEIAYELPFNNPHSKSLPVVEYQMVAYNSRLNIVIIAETFSLYDECTFNTIDCYCYGTSVFDNMKAQFVSRGGSEECVFNIGTYHNVTRIKPLQFVESRACKDAEKGTFDLPSCFTYADDDVCEHLDDYRDRFLSLIPDELRIWFRSYKA